MHDKNERRSVIFYSEVAAELLANTDAWIGFECVEDDVGKLSWKSLLLSKDSPPRIICSARSRMRWHRSSDSAVGFFKEFYPNANNLTLPIRHGEIAPMLHPTKPEIRG